MGGRRHHVSVTPSVQGPPLVRGENFISPRNGLTTERHSVPLYDGHITVSCCDVFVTGSLRFGDESRPLCFHSMASSRETFPGEKPVPSRLQCGGRVFVDLDLLRRAQ